MDFQNKAYYTIPTGNATFKADIGSITMEANDHNEPAAAHPQPAGAPPSTNTSGAAAAVPIHGSAGGGRPAADPDKKEIWVQNYIKIPSALIVRACHWGNVLHESR